MQPQSVEPVLVRKESPIPTANPTLESKLQREASPWPGAKLQDAWEEREKEAAARKGGVDSASRGRSPANDDFGSPMSSPSLNDIPLSQSMDDISTHMSTPVGEIASIDSPFMTDPGGLLATAIDQDSAGGGALAYKFGQELPSKKPVHNGLADKKVALRSMISEMRREFQEYYDGWATSKSVTPRRKGTSELSVSPRSLTPRRDIYPGSPSRGQVAEAFLSPKSPSSLPTLSNGARISSSRSGSLKEHGLTYWK